MDILASAKCGLLEQLTGSYVVLPMWQSVLAAFLFCGAQLGGLYWACRRARIPLSRPLFTPVAKIAFFAAVLAMIGCVLVAGLQYMFFILWIAKDILYCTYFEASRQLTVPQIVLLPLIVFFNLMLTSRFALSGGRPAGAGHAGALRTMISSKALTIVLVGFAYALGVQNPATVWRLLLVACTLVLVSGVCFLARGRRPH